MTNYAILPHYADPVTHIPWAECPVCYAQVDHMHTMVFEVVGSGVITWECVECGHDCVTTTDEIERERVVA